MIAEAQGLVVQRMKAHELLSTPDAYASPAATHARPPRE